MGLEAVLKERVGEAGLDLTLFLLASEKKCLGVLFARLLACLFVKTTAGPGGAHLSVSPV